MIDLEKLSLLVQDRENKLRFTLIKKGLNYHVYIEKLHSLNQWLSIFVKEFSKYNSKSILKGDIDGDSIMIINYLSLCNGIVDSHIGLNKILNDMQDDKYELNTNIFINSRKNNAEHDKFFGYKEYNDFQYFKHVRAVFGQHPSNLEYRQNGESKRAFSSWPFHDSILQKNGCDLYTNIYLDLSRHGGGIRFNLFLDEIELFIVHVLESIKNMINSITIIVNAYILHNCPGVIPDFDKLTIPAKIQILQSEIGQRYSFDDYHYLLDATITLARIHSHNPVVGYEAYNDNITHDIDVSLNEIHSIVSTCDTKELFFFDEFYSNIMDSIGHHYYREKCAMYIIGDIRYMDIFLMVNKEISKILNTDASHGFGDFYYRLYLLSQIKTKVYK
jgi:hypothetical protein